MPYVASGQVTFGDRVKLTNPINRIQYSKVVDMDGDGDVDVVAIADYGPQADWWENDGGGIFTRHTWRPAIVPDQIIFDVADWDGDGRQDLWLTGYVFHEETQKSGYFYMVALGREDGIFEEPAMITAEVETGVSSDSIVIDLNGDSHPDIIGGGRVYIAQSDGSFAGSQILSGELGMQSSYRGQNQFYDYDSDGAVDILLDIESSSQSPRLYRNLGGGTFGAGQVLMEPQADESLSSFVIVKPNTPNESPTLFTITKTSDESTQVLASYSLSLAGSATKTGETELPLQDGDFQLTWGNLQNDGQSGRTLISSFALKNGLRVTRLSEVITAESGLSTRVLREFPGVAQLISSSFQDLNGDGHADLVVPIAWSPGTSGSTQDQILWYAGNSAGELEDQARAVILPGYERDLLNLSDLDGDGDADIIFGNYGPNSFFPKSTKLTLWINQGDGFNFEKHEIPNDGFGMELLGISDQSIGTVKDLLVINYLPTTFDANAYKQIQLAQRNSAGEFVLSSFVGYSLATSSAYYEDWNHDGKKDIVIRDLNGDVHWFERSEAGFLGRKLIMNLPEGSTSTVDSFRIIDIDRDGDLDLFANGNLFGEGTSYWAEQGSTGEIAAIHRLTDALIPLGIDYDNDGHEDFKKPSIAIYLLRAGAMFESISSQNPSLLYGMPPHHGRFQDIDGDGDLDEIMSLPTFVTIGFQRLLWRENIGGAVNYEPASDVLIDGLEYALRDQFALGDLDGDGVKDLLVVSSDTAIVEWFKIRNQPQPPAFVSWMSNQGLSGSSAGPKSDWDGDTISNWEEFVFGTNADLSDGGSAGRPHLEETAGDLFYTFQKRKIGTGFDLNYPLQCSSDLIDWKPWTPILPTAGPNGDYEIIRIPVTPGEDCEFFRVTIPSIPE